MDDSFSDIICYQLKKILPLICTILLILLIYIPIRIPLSKFLRPDVSMICVYFWALYRRDLFGPLSVACVGFVSDSLAATPLGINLFVFMLIYVLAVNFASLVNTKPFIVTWVGFSVICFAAFLVKWLLMSVYYSDFLSFIGIIIGYIATVLLYPLVARLNIFVQNKFLANEEVIYEQR